MKPFEKCPVCNGDLESRKVEKILRGGGITVTIKVPAEVCLRCGERFYTEDIVRRFEEIRNKLKKDDFTHLKILGQSFTVEENWPDTSIRPSG